MNFLDEIKDRDCNIKMNRNGFGSLPTISDGVDDIPDNSGSVCPRPSLNDEFHVFLDVLEEGSPDLVNNIDNTHSSSIPVIDNIQLKERIEQEFFKKLPQLMEYQKNGYNIVGLDEEGMTTLKSMLEEMRMELKPQELEVARKLIISSAQDFLHTLKSSLKKNVALSSEGQESIPQANAVIRNIIVALDAMNAVGRVGGVSWEEEVNRVAEEQTDKLIAATMTKLIKQPEKASSNEYVLSKKNQLMGLLSPSESNLLTKENVRFRQLQKSLQAESRVMRHRLAAYLETTSAQILTGVKDTEKYAIAELLNYKNSASQKSEADHNGWLQLPNKPRDVGLQVNHYSGLGNSRLEAVKNNPQDNDPVHIKIARAILPVSEALGTVYQALNQARDSVKPASEERIKSHQSVWNQTKGNAKNIKQTLYYGASKVGNKVEKTVSRSRSQFNWLPVTYSGKDRGVITIEARKKLTLSPAIYVNGVKGSALLLLDEIQQAERRIKLLPSFARELQEAVEQYASVTQQRVHFSSQPVLCELLDEQLKQEAAQWLVLANQSRDRMQAFILPVTQLAQEKWEQDFCYGLSEEVRSASADKMHWKKIKAFDEVMEKVVGEFATVARKLDRSAVYLAMHGHAGGKELQKKRGQWLQALSLLKEEVDAGVVKMTGRSLDNFSRGGMLARGMAEWAEDLKQSYLQETRSEEREAAAQLFERTLMEVVEENRTYFVKRFDLKAEMFLKRLKLALKHAADNTMVYPPTPEEILAGSRSLPEDIRHWAEKKVVRGAISAAFRGGVKLVTGTLSLPIRVVIRSAKTGRSLYTGVGAINRGVKLGEGPATQIKSQFIKQELSKATFRLTLSLSPVVAWGVAASITVERLYNNHNHYKKIIKNTVIDLPEELLWRGGYAGISAAIRAQSEQAVNQAIEDMLAELKEQENKQGSPVNNTSAGPDSRSDSESASSSTEGSVDDEIQGETLYKEDNTHLSREQDANQSSSRPKRESNINDKEYSDRGEDDSEMQGDDWGADYQNDKFRHIDPPPSYSDMNEATTPVPTGLPVANELVLKAPEETLLNPNTVELYSLAAKTIHTKIYEKTGKRVDPDKTMLIHFDSLMWEGGKLIQSKPIPAESHSLTKWLLRNFRQEVRDNIGVDRDSWGFYPTSHQGEEYVDEIGIGLTPAEFKDMVDEIDFYKKVYMPKLDEYWGDPYNVKQEELYNVGVLGQVIQISELSDNGNNILLNGFGFKDNEKYSVSVSQFNIDGYPATDMLVFIDNKTHKIVLYMPRTGKAKEFQHANDLRRWVLNKCKDEAGRTEILKHFSLEEIRDGLFYYGVEEILKSFSNVDNKSENELLNKVWSNTERIDSPVIEFITGEKRKELEVNADNLIKSDSEVTRDAWIGYMSSISTVIPNPVTPGVSFGLAMEKGINADGADDVSQAKHQLIIDGVNIGMMLVAGAMGGALALPEDAIAAREFNTIDFIKENMSEKTSMELSIYESDVRVMEYSGSPDRSQLNSDEVITFNININRPVRFILFLKFNKVRIKSFDPKTSKFKDSNDFTLARSEFYTKNVGESMPANALEDSLVDMSTKTKTLENHLKQYSGIYKEDITKNLEIISNSLDDMKTCVDIQGGSIYTLVKKGELVSDISNHYGMAEFKYTSETSELYIKSLISHPYVVVNKYPEFKEYLIRNNLISESELSRYNIKNIANYLGSEAVRSEIDHWLSISEAKVETFTFDAANPITKNIGYKLERISNLFSRERTDGEPYDSTGREEISPHQTNVDFYLTLVESMKPEVRHSFRPVNPVEIISDEATMVEIRRIMTKEDAYIVSHSITDGRISVNDEIRLFSDKVIDSVNRAYEKVNKVKELFDLAESRPDIKSALKILLDKAAGLNDEVIVEIDKADVADISEMVYNRFKDNINNIHDFLQSQTTGNYDAFVVFKHRQFQVSQPDAFALPFDSKKRILLAMLPDNQRHGGLVDSVVHEVSHNAAYTRDQTYIGNVRNATGSFPSSFEDPTARDTRYFFTDKRVSQLSTNYALGLPDNANPNSMEVNQANVILQNSRLVKADTLLDAAEYNAFMIDVLSRARVDGSRIYFNAAEFRHKRSIYEEDNSLDNIIMLASLKVSGSYHTTYISNDFPDIWPEVESGSNLSHSVQMQSPQVLHEISVFGDNNQVVGTVFVDVASRMLKLDIAANSNKDKTYAEIDVAVKGGKNYITWVDGEDGQYNLALEQITVGSTVVISYGENTKNSWAKQDSYEMTEQGLKRIGEDLSKITPTSSVPVTFNQHTFEQELTVFMSQNIASDQIDPAYAPYLSAFNSLPKIQDITEQQVKDLKHAASATGGDLLAQAKYQYALLGYLSGPKGIKLPIDKNVIRNGIVQEIRDDGYEYKLKLKEITWLQDQLKKSIRDQKEIESNYPVTIQPKLHVNAHRKVVALENEIKDKENLKDELLSKIGQYSSRLEMWHVTFNEKRKTDTDLGTLL